MNGWVDGWMSEGVGGRRGYKDRWERGQDGKI